MYTGLEVMASKTITFRKRYVYKIKYISYILTKQQTIGLTIEQTIVCTIEQTIVWTTEETLAWTIEHTIVWTIK